MPQDNNYQSTGHAVGPHLALLAVQIMFGTWPIVGKLALRSISSLDLVALRVAGAAVGFVILQRGMRNFLSLPRRDLLQLLLCSVLGVAANQLLYVTGLSLTTAINATLLSTTIPVFTLAVEIVAGNDRLSVLRASGILMAAAGVIFLVNPFRADFTNHTTTGNLLIVANSVSYGSYLVFSKSIFRRYGALNVITWLFVLASIITTPIGLWAAAGSVKQPVSITVWVAVVYTVLMPTLAAYYLNAWALARVPASTVATYIYLQPLIAFGFAPLVLGEHLTLRTILACVLVFGGVALVSRRTNSIKPVEEITATD